MSVFKRYQGKRITSKHPKYAAARWWCYKRVKGHKPIHQSIPEARTREQAELAERRLVDRLFNRRYGVTDTETTFGQFAAVTYWPYVEQNNVNLTAKRIYLRLLNQQWEHKPITEITPQDCRNMQAWLRRKPNERKHNGETISPASVNRCMTTAGKLFNLACEEGVLDRNPMQFVKPLTEPPPRRRLLTVEQKAALWRELLKDELLRRIVILAISMPVRKGQILALRDTDIDFENRLATIIASKGRGSRTIPLNDTAVAVLRQMCDEHRGRLIPIASFRRRWHRALVTAGINREGGSREENYHFHDLRTEFASELIRRGVNPKWVQDLFAHSDTRITDGYIRTGMDSLHAAVSLLDDDNVLGSDLLQ